MPQILIDIHNNTFNIAYLKLEELSNNNSEFLDHLDEYLVKTSVPATVSILGVVDEFVSSDPLFEKVVFENKEYNCIIGNGNNLSQKTIDNTLDLIDCEQNTIVLLALLQHAYKKLKLDITDIKDCSVNIFYHDRYARNNGHNASNQKQLSEIINQIGVFQSCQIKYICSEKVLMNLLIKNQEQSDNLMQIGGVFADLTRKGLTLYVNKPNQLNSFDIEKTTISFIKEVSIDKTLDLLKEKIQQKTGLQNMPLSKKTLLLAFTKGSIGSQTSGLYVDLREEVSVLVEEIADKISQSIINYAISSEQLFGGLFFTGYLSDLFYIKVKELVEVGLSKPTGVSGNIQHIPTNPFLFIDHAVDSLIKANVQQIQNHVKNQSTQEISESGG